MGVRYYLHIVVVAARERARPPRQVGPPVLLRARLREPPAVVVAVARFGYTCKTQAARGSRAEALAAGVGAMAPHHFLKFETGGGPGHAGAVRPRGEFGRLLRQGFVRSVGMVGVVERRLDQLTK